tara:strand:- start:90 stop:257 length:168 start_codon:yes stop_codon:yes gene_type:complete
MQDKTMAKNNLKNLRIVFFFDLKIRLRTFIFVYFMFNKNICKKMISAKKMRKKLV